MKVSNVLSLYFSRKKTRRLVKICFYLVTGNVLGIVDEKCQMSLFLQNLYFQPPTPSIGLQPAPPSRWRRWSGSANKTSTGGSNSAPKRSLQGSAGGSIISVWGARGGILMGWSFTG